MPTLLETVFAAEGSPEVVEHAVVRAIARGSLVLTGTFRGRESEIVTSMGARALPQSPSPHCATSAA